MRVLLLLLAFLSSAAQAVTVWVEREGYHTALVVPHELAARNAPVLEKVLPQKPYVRFGWGDADFYGASRKTLLMGFRALVVSNRSVVEVGGFERPDQAGKKVIAVELDEQGAVRLMSFITGSFTLDASGRPQLSRSEPTGLSYFKARGRYHLLKNCNHWTARGMDRSGMDMPVRTSMFAGQVMKRVGKRLVKG